jgi:tetratricopeptide (TPR) repeat protein
LQGKNLASELIKNEGYKSIQSSLNQLRSDPKAYYFDEQMIDRLAYVWMDQGYPAEALEVYKLNTGIFPRSASANYNLAVAYLKTGDKQSAQASLKNCLELDPDHEDAREALQKLMQ